jgi:hypothetical protein
MKAYAKRIFDAKDSQDTLSVIIDGAKQSAHDVPKVQGRVPGDLTPLSQKVQGVFFHNQALHLYLISPFVQTGGNLTLTCLVRSLQQLAAAGKVFPTTLYLQVDGGTENWNLTLFAFIDLCFDLFPSLNLAYVCRLAAKKGHQDIDRLFSYGNQGLFGTGPKGKKVGKDVLTRDDFKRIFLSALADKPETMLLHRTFEDLDFTYDMKSFLDPHINPEFSGYGSRGEVHLLRFLRKEKSAPPHISYKYWHQSEEWHPLDGSSLTILTTRPDLRTAKISVSAQREEAWKDTLKLQKKILRWMDTQLSLGLATQTHIASWQSYFRTLSQVPKPSFPFEIPAMTGVAPLSSSCASQNFGMIVGKPPTDQAATLLAKIKRQQAGPPVEPITHQGYTKADRRRKLKRAKTAQQAVIDAQKGMFAFVNCPIEDQSYKLPLALWSDDAEVDVAWWIYRGYPLTAQPSLKGPWQKQIKQGPGQREDTGMVFKSHIVCTFQSLNKNKTVPAVPLAIVQALLDREPSSGELEL